MKALLSIIINTVLLIIFYIIYERLIRKNYNKRFFNWSILLSLLLAYVFPYKIDGSFIKCGFPFRFWKIRMSMSVIPNSSLFMSTSLDLFLLAINIVIIYLIISFTYKLYVKKKNKNDDYIIRRENQ